MPTIEVSASTYDRLARQAMESRSTVDAFVAPVLHAVSIASRSGQVAPRRLTDEQFEQVVQSLSKPLPPTAILPTDFSTADVYSDHD